MIKTPLKTPLKILTYLARPEGLGLHGPILDILSSGMFCDDALYELARYGNLWAAITLFGRPSADRNLCISIIYYAIQENCIEQAKFILSAVRDGVIQDDITNLRLTHQFIYSFEVCIAKDYRDMVKILLELIPWNKSELNSYLYTAVNYNKTEIAEMLIEKEKGTDILSYCFAMAVANNNNKLLEILINSSPETPTTNLEYCLRVADNNRNYDCLKHVLNRVPNDLKLIERIYIRSCWSGPSRQIFQEKFATLKSSAMDF